MEGIPRLGTMGTFGKASIICLVTCLRTPKLGMIETVNIDVLVPVHLIDGIRCARNLVVIVVTAKTLQYMRH
jgi:hypothetical protein